MRQTINSDLREKKDPFFRNARGGTPKEPNPFPYKQFHISIIA